MFLKNTQYEDKQTLLQTYTAGLDIAFSERNDNQIDEYTGFLSGLAQSQRQRIHPLAEIYAGHFYSAFWAIAKLETCKGQVIGALLTGKAKYELSELLIEHNTIYGLLVIAADRLSIEHPAKAAAAYRQAFRIYKDLCEVNNFDERVKNQQKISPKPDKDLAARALEGMIQNACKISFYEWATQMLEEAHDNMRAYSGSMKVNVDLREQLWQGLLKAATQEAEASLWEGIRILKPVVSATEQYGSKLQDEAWHAYEKLVDQIPKKMRIAEYKDMERAGGQIIKVREKLAELRLTPAQRGDLTARSFIRKFEL